MANISVNLSQATANALKTLDVGGSANLSQSVGVFFQAAYGYNVSHSYYNSISATSNSVRLNFSDGAYTLLSGVVLDNPNAASGAATASSVQEYVPSAYVLSWGGSLDFAYALSTNGSNIESTGGVITSASLQTLLPYYSSLYDATLGNVTLALQGAIALAGDNFSGTITSISGKADQFLTSSVISGSLQVDGNRVNIGQNLATANVSGTVTGLENHYADGSRIVATGLSIGVNGASTLDESIFTDAANFASDDTINITLPAALSTAWNIASGAGNDTITIQGGGSALSVNAGSGNDRITLGDHNHQVDGGDGLDTLILNGAQNDYQLLRNANGYTLQAKAGGADTLLNIERVQFSDATLALDIDGVGGQAYRIYQAAFNRAPDSAGLGYWISAMEHGVSLLEVSQGFVQSSEFATLYGASASNAEVLTRFYANVLHRTPDAAGYAYWLNVMDTKIATTAEVLANFSESPENQAGVIGVIGNGFTYTPYG